MYYNKRTSYYWPRGNSLCNSIVLQYLSYVTLVLVVWILIIDIWLVACFKLCFSFNLWYCVVACLVTNCIIVNTLHNLRYIKIKGWAATIGEEKFIVKLCSPPVPKLCKPNFACINVCWISYTVWLHSLFQNVYYFCWKCIVAICC